jgi:membrane associated rhomboid family serine protease
MKNIFLIAFIVIYLCFGLELGYTASSPWYTHVTYIFQHANFMHLALNSISFFLLFKVLEKFFSSWNIIIVSLISAFAMSFFCMYDQPVVGASGMIYTMLGMYFFLICHKQIRFKDKATLYVFIFSVTTFLVISFFKPNSAGLLHFLCFLSGFIISSLTTIYSKIK